MPSKYYLEHKDVLKERTKRWYEENREKALATKKAYREANRDKMVMWRFRTALRSFLKMYGREAETGEYYYDLDGIRLVFDEELNVNWYHAESGPEGV